ncbi:MAG: hypothetical protein ISS46_01840 [Candidatus Omnitrophica bacterium]|nr:hypothetical protein [Candidatus Omnitrophota bacterium]
MNKHPYIGKSFLKMESIERRIFNSVNKGRTYRGDAVITTYYLTSKPKKGPVFSGIENAINMMLIHGTVEVWPDHGKEPVSYRNHMSWLKEVRFLEKRRVKESALIKIATPLAFFEKGDCPLSQLRLATASEPFNAFIDFTARVVDYEFPEKFKRKFLGQVWPHKRVREYLNIGRDEPIIGTIVKPKWLPPKLFAQRVAEAALGGALFIKSDENLHMTKQEVTEYVRETVRMLKNNGFDLSREPKRGRKRILFAPHITTNPTEIFEYAQIAVDNGANCLMFSPHLAGDFGVIKEIYQMGEKYRVPIYAHTAGMNRICGDQAYACGEDPRTVYFLAALSGAAFMQLPGIGSYIRPTDAEKKPILDKLKREGLEGDRGMTLVIAGGLSPENIGRNIKILGSQGRMFLAGTSVFHHPGGIKAGIEALKRP